MQVSERNISRVLFVLYWKTSKHVSRLYNRLRLGHTLWSPSTDPSTMFSVAMAKSCTGSDPDDYPFFTPTDPSLRRGTAAFHLEVCIHDVASEAVKHGNSKALVRNRISQHQAQFDAVLDTLDTIFRIGDTQPTAEEQSDNGAVAASDEAEDAPTSFGNDFPDPPQSSIGNHGGFENQIRQVKAEAAQQHLSDEEWRLADFGSWLEGLPEPSGDIAHQLARSSSNAQIDIELRNDQPDNRDRRNASVNQIDVVLVDRPGVGDPTADPMPTRTRSESDLHRPGKFDAWTERKREVARRAQSPGAYGGRRPASQ